MTNVNGTKRVESKKLKQIPILGKWKLIKWFPALYRNTLPNVVKFTATHGDLLNLKWSENSRMILANHPKYVQHILKTNQENYSRKNILGNLADFLGDGLFASEGKLWEQQHKLIKPALHEKLIKDYFGIIHHETKELIANWKEKSIKKQSVDIEYDINVLMLTILIKTQLTSDADVDFKVIIKALRVFLNENNPKRFYFTKAKNQLRQLFGLKNSPNKRSEDALNTLDEIIVSIRTKANANPESMGLVLQVLESAKTEGIISDKQICDEIKNFFFAGFDTTASALTWSLYCYAKNEKEAAALRTEVDSVLQGKDPSMQDLGSMTYTKMFLQESMRMFPPVYALLRVSDLDDNMDGYFVPKKTWMAINIYALHRHPDFWDNPESFDPERFQPKTFKGKAFAYIPFGQGKRSCIGKPLAMAELQIILPMILSQFKLELVDKKEPVISPDIIIKVKKPMLMNLFLRK